jgi:hypothetical protein
MSFPEQPSPTKKIFYMDQKFLEGDEPFDKTYSAPSNLVCPNCDGDVPVGGYCLSGCGYKDWSGPMTTRQAEPHEMATLCEAQDAQPTDDE